MDSYCQTCQNQGSQLFLKGLPCFEKCSLSKGFYTDRLSEDLKNWIRDRDGRICQICRKTEERNGYALDVHHVDYDKQNSDEMNLISLCHSCHKKCNFNKKKWIDYFGKMRDEEGYFK